MTQTVSSSSDIQRIGVIVVAAEDVREAEVEEEHVAEQAGVGGVRRHSQLR